MNSLAPKYPRPFSGKIHFVGIGGVGMSGLAEILSNLGYTVQGSDLLESPVLSHLRQNGIQVFIGHHADNVAEASVVVTSSAIDPNNPEICAAKALRCPILKRAEMLAELMRFRLGIAVAGTHGKTTTTSLIATILSNAGMDPTYVVGGKVSGFGKRANLGAGKYLVVEADESDASFLYLRPVLAVITNIDRDHLENYQFSFATLQNAFERFIKNIPFYGCVVVWNEDPCIQQLREQISRRFITYGFDTNCDIYASDLYIDAFCSHFKVHTAWSSEVSEVQLNLPGKHNVLNALAALAVAHEIGIDLSQAFAALGSFQGIERRFQNYGTVQTPRGSVLLIDDYGHHPSEVNATYQTACMAWPKRRKILVFQPHRFSRLKDLFQAFSAVLATVDCLVLLDVYPAGEKPLPGYNTASLCDSIQEHGAQRPVYLTNMDEVIPVLSNEQEGILCDNDVVIMMGAGSIGGMAQRFSQAMVKAMESEHAPI